MAASESSNSRTTVTVAKLLSNQAESSQVTGQDDDDPFTFTDTIIRVATLTGKTITLTGVKWYSTVHELKSGIRDVEGIPLYQQRLVFEGKQLEDYKCLYEYKLHLSTPEGHNPLHLVLRLRGGGYSPGPDVLGLAIACADWSGKMHHPSIKGIELSRNDVFRVLGLVYPGWLLGQDHVGNEGYFPLTHVHIARIFRSSFREELTATSSQFIKAPLPESTLLRTRQQPTATTSNVEEHGSECFCLGFGLFSFARKKAVQKTVQAEGDEDEDGVDFIERQLLSEDKQLPVEEQTSLSLPPFPYPNPDPPRLVKVKLGEDGESFVALEFSCSKLKSPDDTPTIRVVFKCFPIPPARVSSAVLTFKIPDNEVVGLSPREQLGPVTETQISQATNQKLGVQAGVAVEGVTIGANFAAEKGVETSGTRKTQLSIMGSSIGTSEARWTLVEDTSEIGHAGLPLETELLLKVRYKPRLMVFRTRIAAASKGKSDQIYEKSDVTIL